MKRTLKTTLAALTLALVFLLASCAGGGTASIGGKYDGITQLNGFNTIAYQKGVQRVFKKNRAVGDGAFQITESVGKGDFFIAKKTADSGFGLMNSNGKFISKFTDLKINQIGANIVGWQEKSNKGVDQVKYEINYFAATLNLTAENEKDETARKNNKAIMTLKGEILSGRYSDIATDGHRIILAEKTEKEGDPAVEVIYTYALRTDGTQIGRRIKCRLWNADFSVQTNNQTGNSVVSIKKETAPDADGNSYDVFKPNGDKLSDAVSSATAKDMLGLFEFTKKPNNTSDAEKYYIKKDLTVEKRDDVKALYSYNNVYYIIEGKTSDNSFKLKTVNEKAFDVTADKTSGYKELKTDPDTSGCLRGETSNEKYDYLLFDGTPIVSGVAKAGSQFSFTSYNTYEKDYGYIVKDDQTLKAKIAGVEKTKTLASSDTIPAGGLSASNGCALIQNGAEYKLWLPYGDKTIDITAAPVSEDSVLRMWVKKDGKEYFYGAPARNLKYWDGNLLSGNLLIDVCGLKTEADLERTKFSAEPTTSLTLSTSAAMWTPKAKSYASSYANTVEADKASRKLPREISGGSVTYKLKHDDPAKEESVTYYALAYGLNDSYTKYNIKALGKSGEGEQYSDRSGPYAVTRSTKANYTLISTVWKVQANRSGAAELKEIVNGLNNATFSADGLGNRYIWAKAADGTDEIYSETGKLMLRGGLFTVAAIQNYNAAVQKGNPGAGEYGIIKLNKNGGYKMLKNLEWYRYSFLADGSFTVKAENSNRYGQLCNSNGKVLEKAAAVTAGNDAALSGVTLGGDYNDYRIYNDGAKEIIKQYEVKTASGTSRVLTIKITEKMLDFAITELV